MTGGAAETNWAGNLRYRARRLLEPTSVDEVRRLLPGSRRVRALGSRHSFNDIADTDGDLISLSRLPRTVRIDGARRRVTVDGGARYGDICDALERSGFALHALASLPHISVAGAIATATHGSGDEIASLAGAVLGIELVTATGDVVGIDGDSEPALLEASTVALGALGIVTSLTLAIEESYRMRQDVYEGLSAAAFGAHFEAITGSCDSASFFTSWTPEQGFYQVWLKRRVGGVRSEILPDLFGAAPAVRPMHPIPGLSPDACTTQLGIPGPWHERAPHFRFEDTPSSGAELQSEYFVARADAPAAAAVLFGLGDRISPLIQASEVRTVAEERWWLSPAHGRASATFHFTWVPDWEAVRAVLPLVESALAPFAPRPHWAKLSTMAAADVTAAYERWPSFLELMRRFDPDGVFRNEYLDRLVG